MIGLECPVHGHERYWLRGVDLDLCFACRRKTSPTDGNGARRGDRDRAARRATAADVVNATPLSEILRR
jgi:hypothetical protein